MEPFSVIQRFRSNPLLATHKQNGFWGFFVIFHGPTKTFFFLEPKCVSLYIDIQWCYRYLELQVCILPSASNNGKGERAKATKCHFWRLLGSHNGPFSIFLRIWSLSCSSDSKLNILQIERKKCRCWPEKKECLSFSP